MDIRRHRGRQSPGGQPRPHVHFLRGPGRSRSNAYRNPADLSAKPVLVKTVRAGGRPRGVVLAVHLLEAASGMTIFITMIRELSKGGT